MAVIKIMKRDSACWCPHGRDTVCSAYDCQGPDEGQHAAVGLAMYTNARGVFVYSHLCEKQGRAWCEANGLEYPSGRSKDGESKA